MTESLLAFPQLDFKILYPLAGPLLLELSRRGVRFEHFLLLAQFFSKPVLRALFAGFELMQPSVEISEFRANAPQLVVALFAAIIIWVLRKGREREQAAAP